MKFKVGDKIRVCYYNELKCGEVVSVPKSRSIIWVKFENDKVERWFHATSLTKITDRLNYLRRQLKMECISYDELHELQSLAKYIDSNDVELLEVAGVPEKES